MNRHPPTRRSGNCPTAEAGKRATPIHLLTGFLGSGKTTLLNRLLAAPAMADSAVLINEFGETPIDHLLVDSIDDEIVVLESGCVCCSVGDDLTRVLLSLHEKQQCGALPQIQRVVLETTGIADPLPICRMLMTEDDLTALYRNGRIITVVDAVYGNTHLDQHLEAAQQVVVADRLVISKTDLVALSELELITDRVQSLNASSDVFFAGIDSNIDDLLRGLGSNRLQEEPAEWLRSLPVESPVQPGHETRFSTFTIKWQDVIEWTELTAWLEGLLSARGDQIYRLKGIVNVAGSEGPILIQGVQHSLYPPVSLNAWQHKARTELVFITRDFPEQAAINSVYDVLGIKCDVSNRT